MESHRSEYAYDIRTHSKREMKKAKRTKEKTHELILYMFGAY